MREVTSVICPPARIVVVIEDAAATVRNAVQGLPTIHPLRQEFLRKIIIRSLLFADYFHLRPRKAQGSRCRRSRPG